MLLYSIQSISLCRLQVTLKCVLSIYKGYCKILFTFMVIICKQILYYRLTHISLQMWLAAEGMQNCMLHYEGDVLGRTLYTVSIVIYTKGTVRPMPSIMIWNPLTALLNTPNGQPAAENKIWMNTESKPTPIMF